MPGLKRHNPGIQFSGILVRPDEMDNYTQYIVAHPSVGSAYFGTDPGTITGAITLTATRADYPRNLLVTHESGTVGGTLAVSGQNQFGVTITEDIGFATAATSATGTGTSVFAVVGTASWTPDAGVEVGSLSLGVAIGTSATSPMIGLPVKLGGTSDIKAITWVDSDVTKQHDAAAAANTDHHAFKGTAAIAAADSYVVLVKSTYNKDDEDTIANL